MNNEILMNEFQLKMYEINDNSLTLNSEFVDYYKSLIEAEEKIKNIKKNINETLLGTMQALDINKIEDKTQGITITKKAGYKRENFKKTEFKEANRVLYDKYIEFVDVAETITIKVNKEDNNAM